MPVAEDELLLLIRRLLTVVVDVVEERLRNPALLMYPPPIVVDGVTDMVPVPTLVPVEAEDLLTLRSVGPAVSMKIIKRKIESLKLH